MDLYSKKRHFYSILRDVFVLVISVVTLLLIILFCYNTPLHRLRKDTNHIDWASSYDYVFLGIFTLEFFVKTIADGVVYTPNAYLSSPWNLIDFFCFNFHLDRFYCQAEVR